jgi:HK97 family phage portal protein
VSLISRLLERRTVTSFGPFGDCAIPPPGHTGSVHAGEPVSDHTALNLVSFYASVRLLADIVASLPWDAFRKRSPVREEVDPQPTLLREPFRGATGDGTDFEFKHAIMVSLAMRGNFYGLITRRDRLEFPLEIEPLHPDWVQRTREVIGRRQSGPVITTINGERVPNEDIAHIRGFTPPGSLEALSPIGLARHSIGLGLAAQRFGSTWFRDGAAPSGQLTTDQHLTPDQVQQNQQQWISTHGGRRLPAVMTGGMKYEPITITPEESQFLATREFSVKEMAMLVGVPPHMIGDVDRSTSWGSGIEQQSIGFVTYNLRSWLTRIEAVMSHQLPRGQFVRFNVAALLRGDTKSRYEAYTQARNAGWLNVDEIRELEDRPPVPDGAGASYIQPLNMGPLGHDPTDGDGDAR